MPRPTSSVIGIQSSEEDTAVLIGAGECVKQLRIRDDLLRRHDKITSAVFHDSQKLLDYIDYALMVGRRNTARLRRQEAGDE